MSAARAAVTGDAQSRDMVLVQLDDRHFDDLAPLSRSGLMGGGPLDAPDEILTGGVSKPYSYIRGYASFIYRDGSQP